MQSYIAFVRSNEDFVRPLEGLLRTVTFFLPSRFHEHGAGELTTEAALAASNVLTLFHDLILEQRSGTVQPPTPTPQLPAAATWSYHDGGTAGERLVDSTDDR